MEEAGFDQDDLASLLGAVMSSIFIHSLFKCLFELIIWWYKNCLRRPDGQLRLTPDWSGRCMGGISILQLHYCTWRQDREMVPPGGDTSLVFIHSLWFVLVVVPQDESGANQTLRDVMWSEPIVTLCLWWWTEETEVTDVNGLRTKCFTVCLKLFRCEPSLPHDLHPRQVQSEHRTPGLLLCHLGPSGDHVRHAGSGEDTHTHTMCLRLAFWGLYLTLCVCVCVSVCVCLCVCVCVCVALQHESEILPFPNTEKSFSLPDDIIQEVKEGETWCHVWHH